jgi:hypothetical protein
MEGCCQKLPEARGRDTFPCSLWRKNRPADVSMLGFQNCVRMKFCCFICFFETGPYCVAQAGLKLELLLPLPPECWDRMYLCTWLSSIISSHPVYGHFWWQSQEMNTVGPVTLFQWKKPRGPA